MLAGKISLAVRRDVFTKTFDENVSNEFIEKVEEIEKNNPFPTKTSKKRKEEKSKSKSRKRKGKKKRKRR
jgi:nucleolar protein 56